MKTHPIVARAFAFAAISLMAVTGLSAQSASNNSSDSSSEKSVFDKLGFDESVPTGIKKTFREAGKNTDGSSRSSKSDNKGGTDFLPDGGHAFSIGVDASVVYQGGKIDGNAQGHLSVNIGYQIGPVAAALRLTPDQLISRALSDDFEANGDTYTNGVTTVNVKDIIEKGVITLTIFRYVNAEGKEVFALAGTVGRDAATPLGSFVMEGWPAVSILEDRSLSQLDQVKVSAKFFENTMVEVVNFGYDWLGYTVDPLKNVEQSGGDSWAINVTHKFDKILGDGTSLELYMSYADIAEGLTYTRATAGNQPGENQTYAAGAKLNWKKFTLAAEGYMEQPKSSGLDDRYGFSAQAGYWIGKIQPVAGFEMVDSSTSQDTIYSLGANWRVMNNVIISFLTQFVRPENGEDATNYYIGIKLGEHMDQANAKDTRSESN